MSNMHLQNIGTNAQGLANAILFCAFTTKVRKTLWKCFLSHLVRLRRCCCCGKRTNHSATANSDYDKLHESDDENICTDEAYISGETGKSYGGIQDERELSVTASFTPNQSPKY